MQDVVQRVQTTWRRLKNQFRWSFVEDEAAFADEIVRVLQTRPDPQTITDTQINMTIQGQYNRLLHQAVVWGMAHLGDDQAADVMDRACQEIHLNVLRQVRAKGYDQQVAEDIAQKVIVRLIERPSAVDKPEALPGWIKYQILDFLKVINRQPTHESLDQEDRTIPAPALAQNPIQQIDDRLFVEYVLDELPKILSPFQLRVIQLVVLEDQSAIEAASVLGVDPARVRTEKGRAIHRIRRHLGL